MKALFKILNPIDKIKQFNFLEIILSISKISMELKLVKNKIKLLIQYT